jgi:hypothetical protein
MRRVVLIIIATGIAIACTKRSREAGIISSPKKNAESVFLTHDHKTHPVIAWTERTSEELSFLFAVSGDEGKSFFKPVSVQLQEDVATHAEGMPKIAFKRDGTIMIAYERKAPTTENKYAGSICFITSDDGGKCWSSEKFVHSDTTGGRSRSYFDIETLPDGEIGASWLDIKLNNETGGRSILFAKTNSSNRFGKEILIDSSACQCCRVDVYKDHADHVVIAYRGLKKSIMGRSIRDMMAVTSTDNGLTFSAPIIVSADNWAIDGCPHTGPSLCSNSSKLFTLWYTEGNGNGVYYTHKSKSDDEFFPRELVSNAGRHPQLSANDDQIAMVWEENSGDPSQQITNIHYRIIRDGIDIRKDVLSAGNKNAYFPVVTPTKQGFLTAYLQEADNHVIVYFQCL